MAMKRFMAIHTYHSEAAKKAMMQWAAENTASQKEFMATQVFDKCRTVATWIGSDDFFFCHWLAETDEDIHNALGQNGMDQLVITACYETSIHIDEACVTGERAFPISALEAMENA